MNIWKYQNNYKYKIEEEFQLELELNYLNNLISVDKELLKENEINLESLTFWNELNNPTNSFKDRSLLYQISYYFQKVGNKDDLSFAISSSGNAAIAAANICNKYNFKLNIFVSDKLNLEKLDKLNNFKSDFIKIHQSSKAKSDCVKFCEMNNATNLRASSDDIAIEGYKSLGYEIFENNLDFDSIFVTCSSGTATLGIYQGLKEKHDEIGKILPQFHIIQTDLCHPIAGNILKLSNVNLEMNKNEEVESNFVTCVVDKVAKRKDEITKLVLETSGSAWILENKDLENAKLMFSNLVKLNIEPAMTWNALSSFAGMLKAKENNFEFRKPLIIISGI